MTSDQTGPADGWKRFPAIAILAFLIAAALGYLMGLLPLSGKPTTDKFLERESGSPVTPEVSTAKQETARPEETWNTFLIQAHENPRKALAELEALITFENQSYFQETYAALFSSWAERNPDGAIAGLKTISNGPFYSAIDAVLNAVFPQDPEKGAALMREWGHRSLPKWLTDHPTEACRLVPEVAGTQDGADHFSPPAAWAKTDPAAAFEWAKKQPGWARGKALNEVARAWPKADLPGAVGAYETGQFTDHDTRQTLLNAIIKERGRKNPGGTLDWLTDQQDDRNLRRAGDNVITEWAKKDFDAALAWALKAETPHQQKEAMNSLATVLAGKDVVVAADFVSSNETEIPWSARTVQRIGSNYLRKDPQAALEWADSLPDLVRFEAESSMFAGLFSRDSETALAEFEARLPRLSSHTADQLAYLYYRKDSSAAEKWFETLPPGPAAEAARSGFNRAANQSRQAPVPPPE